MWSHLICSKSSNIKKSFLRLQFKWVCSSSSPMPLNLIHFRAMPHTLSPEKCKLLSVKKRLKYLAKWWRVESFEKIAITFVCVSRYEFWRKHEIQCNLSSFHQMLPSYKVIFVVINFSHFFPDSIKDKWNKNKEIRRKKKK